MDCSKSEQATTLNRQAAPGRVDQQTERILQASEADADAERRAFLKAFEADDQERRRDEALESALRAYEPTSPTSASVSVQYIQ